MGVQLSCLVEIGQMHGEARHMTIMDVGCME